VSHNCHKHFERIGSWEVTPAAVVFYGECNQCFRPLKDVYGYAKTVDDETGETLHSADSEA
jgi:hypothetical protein